MKHVRILCLPLTTVIDFSVLKKKKKTEVNTIYNKSTTTQQLNKARQTMSTLSYKKQDAYSSNVGIPDKMAVFQECLQQFNASPVNAKKCRQLLAKLLRLIYNGESFPAQESTTLFFSISKLFQHKDQSLRQLVYLTIKELSSISDDILMVTSSIMKDIQGNDAVYKPNAIRTLSKVLDPTTVNAAEDCSRCLLIKIQLFLLLPVSLTFVTTC